MTLNCPPSFFFFFELPTFYSSCPHSGSPSLRVGCEEVLPLNTQGRG